MQIRADDMIAAYRTVRGRPRGTTVAAWSIALVGMVLAIVVDDRMRPWLVACVSLIVAGELLMLLIDRIWMPRCMTKLHAQHRALHEDIDVRVGADGLEMATPLSRSTLPWSHVLRWYDAPTHLVLMQTDSLLIVVPRDRVDADTLQRVRDALLAHRGAPRRARR